MPPQQQQPRTQKEGANPSALYAQAECSGWEVRVPWAEMSNVQGEGREPLCGEASLSTEVLVAYFSVGSTKSRTVTSVPLTRKAFAERYLASFLREAFVAGRLRHPDGAGVAGPCERGDHDDLHACDESRRPGCGEPGRCAGRCATARDAGGLSLAGRSVKFGFFQASTATGRVFSYSASRRWCRSQPSRFRPGDASPKKRTSPSIRSVAMSSVSSP